MFNLQNARTGRQIIKFVWVGGTATATAIAHLFIFFNTWKLLFEIFICIFISSLLFENTYARVYMSVYVYCVSLCVKFYSACCIQYTMELNKLYVRSKLSYILIFLIYFFISIVQKFFNKNITAKFTIKEVWSRRNSNFNSINIIQVLLNTSITLLFQLEFYFERFSLVHSFRRNLISKWRFLFFASVVVFTVFIIRLWKKKYDRKRIL